MTYAEQAGLEKVDMSFYKSSFVSGASNANRLRLQYFLRRDDGRLFADIWFGPEPPARRTSPTAARWPRFSTRRWG